MKAHITFSDSILVERAQTGDADAYGVLYRRYVGKIYRFIFFRIKDSEAVDDLTNDVFLKFWKLIQSGATVQHVKAYLYKIARNSVIDYYRTRREHVELQEAHNIVDDGQDVMGDVMMNDDIRQLLQKIESLAHDHKELLLLRYVEDLSIAEISKIVGKSKGAVRVAIHRATAKLKTVYTSE